MENYNLRFRKDGVIVGREYFSNSTSLTAFLLLKSRTEPAELWRNEMYLTTIYSIINSQSWHLVQETDLATEPDIEDQDFRGARDEPNLAVTLHLTSLSAH